MATAESYGFIKPTGSDYIKEGDDAISHNADVTARLITFMEGLAAEPGSRLENFVYDPAPANAPESYGSGNVAIVQAPGWGRAAATVAAATTVFAYLNKTGSTTERRKVAVQAGQPVAARVELRAMPTQKMSATLSVIGWKADGSSETLFTSGQLDMEADAARTFQAAGVIPESSGVLYAEIRWTFRRFGETYPSVGDFIFFRRALLTAGPNAPSTAPVDYFDGNTSGAYWNGEPNLSSSVILRPRSSSGGSGIAAGAAHAARVDEWSGRMGGRWNCGKVATVSVRIDHGLANLWAKLKPILDAHSVPATIALGADTWSISENSGVTPAMVNTAVSTGRYAIASHGWGNHLDTADPALIFKYVVESKAKLESDIPASAPIDIFMPPGAAGGGSYGGFLPTLTPEKYSDTLAGQLALSTYPLCTGQFSGTAYRVQDGSPRIGQSYLNMDQFTDAQVLTRVNTAIASGKGIQLMIHPSLIDSGAGYITTAQLSSLFATLKTMHNAGTIRFVTVAEQYLADSTSPITVDQTAGRTVRVWDYLNSREQMIYGETGLRDISASVGNMTSGTIEVSRESGRVFYKLYNVVPTNPALPITLGTAFARGNGFYNSEKVWHRLAPYGAPILTHKQMSGAGSEILIGSPVAAGGVSCSFSHPTTDPWPLTLPGVAA